MSENEKHWTGTAVWFGSRRDVYGTGTTAEEVTAKWEAEGYKAVQDVKEREPRFGWTVVFGQFKWGAGVDLDAAKAQFRRQGGKLSAGYHVVAFDDETDFLGFGGMGYEFLGNAPTSTEVAAKKKASK